MTFENRLICTNWQKENPFWLEATATFKFTAWLCDIGSYGNLFPVMQALYNIMNQICEKCTPRIFGSCNYCMRTSQNFLNAFNEEQSTPISKPQKIKTNHRYMENESHANVVQHVWSFKISPIPTRLTNISDNTGYKCQNFQNKVFYKQFSSF